MLHCLIYKSDHSDLKFYENIICQQKNWSLTKLTRTGVIKKLCLKHYQFLQCNRFSFS